MMAFMSSAKRHCLLVLFFILKFSETLKAIFKDVFRQHL